MNNTMKRKTIIYAVVDKKNKKFVVRNRNTDDFCKQFRELFSDLCEMNTSLDGVALSLNDTLANDDWRFFAVFDAPNNYNRDQTEINKRKSHYKNHYLIEGYTEDPSLDNDGSTIKYKTDYVNKIINNRNLGVLLDEKSEELQQAIENKEIEKNKKINEIDKQFKEFQDEIRIKSEKFIKYKRNELKNKLNEENYNYQLSLNKIKDNYYNEIEKLKDDVLQLGDKKKTLENECSEIVKLKNKEELLKTEIKFIESSKSDLEADLQELYDELNKKQSSVLSLNAQIEKLKNTYNQVNNDLLSKNKLLSVVNNKIETIDEKTRFYAKDFADLQMWESFARDYGYDKTGIIKLRADIDKLKKNNAI